jgi:hypothetical protein
MSNLDHERLREIESSAKKVDELAKILDFQRQETKFARQAWEAAVERHLEMCRATEDSQDVAEAPLLRRIEEVGAEANGRPAWADETFAALVSVGHTEHQARARVDRAIASGRQFASVQDAIEWIYGDQPIVADAVTEPPEPAADHEVDEPEWHGEPVPNEPAWDGVDEPSTMARDGWDLVTSQPMSDDAKAEADALAKIEAGGKKAKGRKRSKAQQG